MRPLAIVSGDWHIHDWQTFNEDYRRTNSQLQALKAMGNCAKELKVPIIFTGDFGHAFGRVSLDLWYKIAELFRDWEANNYPKIIGISGNHDQEKANYDIEEKSQDLWDLLCILFPNVCVDLSWATKEVSSINFMGIPYITYNKSFNKWVEIFRSRIKRDMYNVLVIHSDLYGAMDNGREVGTVEGIPKNMDEYFKDFDLILSGHIHLPQRLGKKIYMVGAMSEQRRSDSGGKFGFWVLGENNGKLKMKFTHLSNLPKFITLEPGKLPPDQNNYYITSQAQLEDKDEVEMGFSNKSSKGQLVRNYLKAIGENSVTKRIALTKLLNDSQDD